VLEVLEVRLVTQVLSVRWFPLFKAVEVATKMLVWGNRVVRAVVAPPAHQQQRRLVVRALPVKATTADPAKGLRADIVAPVPVAVQAQQDKMREILFWQMVVTAYLTALPGRQFFMLEAAVVVLPSLRVSEVREDWVVVETDLQTLRLEPRQTELTV
jgi:hypothetical protein